MHSWTEVGGGVSDLLGCFRSQCESKGQDSEDSEGEEDEGDFSVYEYPGLAPVSGLWFGLL